MLSGLQIALQGVGFGAGSTALQGFVESFAEQAFAAGGGGGGRRRIEQSRSLNDLLRKALRKPKPFAEVTAVVEKVAEERTPEVVVRALEDLLDSSELERDFQTVSAAVLHYALAKAKRLQALEEEEEFVVTQLLLM